MKQDIAEIAGKLTKAQRQALMHINAGGTAYTWSRIGTLEALRARHLVGRVAGRGSMFSPTTAITWPLTSLGLAVRAHLLAHSYTEKTDG